MKKINIAIDGPSGSGKGTTAKLLARKLNYKYLDTGAMYRAVAYFLDLKGFKSDEEIDFGVLDEIEIFFDGDNNVVLNGENIEDKIRTPGLGKLASDFSKIGEIREFLVEKQKEIVREKTYVAEGRDIGTVVIVDAELKIFLTATVDARAQRRLLDFQRKGIDISFNEVKRQIEERDLQDSSREIAPLIKAEDAIEVDTSNLTIDEQVEKIEKLALEIINEN